MNLGLAGLFKDALAADLRGSVSASPLGAFTAADVLITQLHTDAGAGRRLGTTGAGAGVGAAGAGVGARRLSSDSVTVTVNLQVSTAAVRARAAAAAAMRRVFHNRDACRVLCVLHDARLPACMSLPSCGLPASHCLFTIASPYCLSHVARAD